MDNYYDHETGDWVTDRSRYEKVLAEPRFDAIRNDEIREWPAPRSWALVLDLLPAVPEDTLQPVGYGPLEDFVRAHAVDFIGQIEDELPEKRKTRKAAFEMYLRRGDLPPAIEARLSAAIGPSLGS